MKSEKKKFTVNETLMEMLLGILLFGGVIWLAGIWLAKDKFLFSLGLGLGLLLACFASWHMWRGLDTGLDLGDAAIKYITRQNMIRYGIIVVSYGIICVFKLGDPVAAFIGIMGIKAGAYLQPFTHKLYTKRKRR
ncbi:MAG: hypothetical protein IJP31_02930 [Lachnospiraceae bacterium]|nr:hypothetical protein [Lachnospiraceae bacterium]